MIIHEATEHSTDLHPMRVGKPSSSRFGDLITGTGKPSDSLDEYAYELAAEVYTGKAIDDGFFGNKYTRRGHELEPVSRAEYEMQEQVEVTPVGFITDDLMRWGTSTDGLVGKDGLVEFKNLISKSFMKLLVYLKRNNGAIPTHYIPQVQGELMISERKWCDLVFYHPDYDMKIIRVYPNLKFQKTLTEQLTKVIARRKEFIKLIRS